MRIYFDYNAGAPMRPEVRKAMAHFLDDDVHGNSSSVHRAGQRARRLLEDARSSVASLIGASPRRIIFTSGGTESNNLAIFGAVGANAVRRRIVTSSIEHSSILAPLRELHRREFEIVKVAPDADGRIGAQSVIDALDDHTALVSLGLANAEVGTIQDLAPLSALIEEAGALFHIDAAQALGRIPVSVEALRCDLLTLSGHKLGSAGGIGALYVREGLSIAPVILGGPQEAGLRAGTPNLAGAVALGAAADVVATNLREEAARVAAMADLLLARLRASIPGLRLNGPAASRLANTLNLTFPGVLGESMMIALDLEGVEVSMGSACAAGAVEPSHVLLAMGRSAAEARSSLRVSLGWGNTMAEIESTAGTIARVWRRVIAAEPIAAEARA